MRTHILIVNAVLILFVQKSFSQDEKFLYTFEEGIDSIGATKMGETKIFIYNPDYKHQIKAYKEAESKRDPNIPIFPSAPYKYFLFTGFEAPKGINYSQYIHIGKEKLLKKRFISGDNYYMLVPMEEETRILRLERFTISEE
jgi:hypothetical protein